jgi:hypothetical protein
MQPARRQDAPDQGENSGYGARRALNPRGLLVSCPQKSDEEQHGPAGDAYVGQVEGPEPQVADSDIDEIHHTAGRTEAVEQVPEGTAGDEREPGRREVIAG